MLIKNQNVFCGNLSGDNFYFIVVIHFPAAFSAMQTMPYGIELVGCGVDQRRIVGEDARLEIAGRRAFHPEPRSRQIGRADVGDLAIEKQHFEMYTAGTADVPADSIATDICRNHRGNSGRVLWRGATALRHRDESNPLIFSAAARNRCTLLHRGL